MSWHAISRKPPSCMDTPGVPQSSCSPDKSRVIAFNVRQPMTAQAEGNMRKIVKERWRGDKAGAGPGEAESCSGFPQQNCKMAKSRPQTASSCQKSIIEPSDWSSVTRTNPLFSSCCRFGRDSVLWHQQWLMNQARKRRIYSL